MNRNHAHTIFSNVIRYGEITEHDEILKVLEKLDYDINEEDYPYLDSTLQTLLDKGLSLENLLTKYDEYCISNINATINRISDSFLVDKYDSLIILVQSKISDEQRTYLFQKISSSLNVNDYTTHRLPHLIKLLSKEEKNKDKIIALFDLFITNQIILREDILKEYCEIIESSTTIVDDNLLIKFINLLIEKKLSTDSSNILKIICKYKNRIGIDNIRKMKSYVEVIVNSDTYPLIFELYKENSDIMLQSEDTAEQLEFFLVELMTHSGNLIETLNLIENKLEEINKLDLFISNFVKVESGSDAYNIFRTIMIAQLDTRSTEEQENVINGVINYDLFSAEEISKINNLLASKDCLDFERVIKEHSHQASDNFKLNCLKIFIERKNNQSILESLSLIIEDISNETLIANALDILKNSKLKFSEKENQEFWIILNSGISTTSSSSLIAKFQELIITFKFRAPKTKATISEKQPV